jgi:hypothetical protein
VVADLLHSLAVTQSVIIVGAAFALLFGGASNIAEVFAIKHRGMYGCIVQRHGRFLD